MTSWSEAIETWGNAAKAWGEVFEELAKLQEENQDPEPEFQIQPQNHVERQRRIENKLNPTETQTQQSTDPGRKQRQGSEPYTGPPSGQNHSSKSNQEQQTSTSQTTKPADRTVDQLDQMIDKLEEKENDS